MELIDKKINEALNKELEANEGDRVEAFKQRAERNFFATLSGFIDNSFFMDEETGKYDKKKHQENNQTADHSLCSDLKRLGLNYQKVTGAWAGSIEKSFVVWNTAYTWEQFQQIMLKLNEIYKQWGICIGRKSGDKYDIDLWETDSLKDITYKKTSHFTKINVVDALKESGTILTRKINNKQGEISPKKVNRGIVFESVQTNPCLAASESLMGSYKRKALLKDLLK